MISFNLHKQLGKYSLPYFTDEETETEKSVICLKLDTKQEGSRLNRFLSSPRKKFGLQMSSRYERSGKVVSSPSVEDCECPGEGIRRPDTASFSADAECRAQVFCETQNYSRRPRFLLLTGKTTGAGGEQLGLLLHLPQRPLLHHGIHPRPLGTSGHLVRASGRQALI